VGWGKAADTYALRIIAWQLLTGDRLETPLAAVTASSVRASICCCSVRKPCLHEQECSMQISFLAGAGMACRCR
jgi:hypothetical protein